MNYYNHIKLLLEANIFKQARRHLSNMQSGAFSHATQRGDSNSRGLFGILNTDRVMPGNRNIHGVPASYWVKGKPDRSYGDLGVTIKNIGNLKPSADFKPKGSPYSSTDYKHYLDVTPEGTPLQRKDTAHGISPEDTDLIKSARSKGLRVVTKPASDAAETAFFKKSPIDFKGLMRTHRRNRKLARRLRRQGKI